MHQHNSQEMGEQSKRGPAAFGLVLRALSVSVEVFMRDSRTFGQRYLGVQAAAAIGVLCIYSLFCDPSEAGWIYGFLCIYVFALAVARGQSNANRRRAGVVPHSYYSGRPLLMRLNGHLKEGQVKGVLEPIVVWVAGGVIVGSHPALGFYLILAGTAVMLTSQVANAAERKRVLDMHDAYMQQRQTVEEWRDVRRD